MPAPSFSPLRLASERCKACELCVAACPAHVLALDMGSLNHLGYHPIELLDPALCTSCALCARVCPDAVFEVFARSRSDPGTFGRSRSDPGKCAPVKNDARVAAGSNSGEVLP